MYIYKFYDKDKELLYIGKTKDLKQRIKAHYAEKKIIGWKNDIDYIEVAKCDNETDMNIYEVYYINTLNPKHNSSEKYNISPTFKLEELHFVDYEFEIPNLGKKLINEISENDIGKLTKLFLYYRNKGFKAEDCLKLFDTDNIRTCQNYIYKMKNKSFIIKKDSLFFVNIEIFE